MFNKTEIIMNFQDKIANLSNDELDTLEVFMWDNYKIDIEAFKELIQHVESDSFIEFIKELNQ